MRGGRGGREQKSAQPKIGGSKVLYLIPPVSRTFLEMGLNPES